MSMSSTAAAAAADDSHLTCYELKTELQHVLSNPDTYVGNVDISEMNMFVATTETRIESKSIVCNMGLYKLFDEVLVNTRDHVVRTTQAVADGKPNEIQCDMIDVTFLDTGVIRVRNNGTGVPIERHPIYNIYIPELIFANMRTSSNYNKSKKTIVGGKNGLGGKLAIIWSTWARIECVDATTRKKYVQEIKNNMTEICAPKITSLTATHIKPYTQIEFLPDYIRFGFETPQLTPDMRSLFHKRVLDIAAITDKRVKITLNGATVPIKTFKQYISLYTDADAKIVYEESGARWEYAVALAPSNEFVQVSFVNGIFTRTGGKHVEYVLGQIVRKVMAYILAKKKVSVSFASIKEQLMLFLRCDIENPSFDSQSKDTMTLPVAKFGSICEVSDAFCEKVAKLGVMNMACNVTEARETRAARKTDGTKTRSVRGIANFIDANHAGSARSKDCVLILCEGLSAQSGVISGLTSEDRNYYGVYPLKGKLLNVRGETTKKIADNKEITDLKRILGLEKGREYLTLDDVHKKLRYGRVMFLTDADTDGHHIKGLCINLFHCEWSSLTKITGFLSFMNTPILRATHGPEVLSFYNKSQYDSWRESMSSSLLSRWRIKYFKGLGTSTSREFKEYFANNKVVAFNHTGETSDDKIDKIFNKKRADERKVWLENYDKNVFLDTSIPTISYEDFIDRELIHFSVYDCERSIPNMVDGLKISQRKVLYCAFKRNLTTEIKVAQFSGYVSEHASYHHGEQSLNKCIVGMAQNYVGSNNIHPFVPKGQFGTRLQGGADSAAERYIFTQLHSLTRLIFPAADDSVLTYLDDDGTTIEPEFYVPIIPYVLINGAQGIGTGFSTSIPSFNPLDLVSALRILLTARIPTPELLPTEFMPYYHGFKGNIMKMNDNKFIVSGLYEIVDNDKIVITELPVGTWTMTYITYLEECMSEAEPIIKDIVNMSTETTVNIQVQFYPGKLQKISAAEGGVEKAMKLTTTITTTNMHLFTDQLKLKKYSSIGEIVWDFFQVRIQTFARRKEYVLECLRRKHRKLSNKARYIQAVLDDVVDLRRKTAQQIDDMLYRAGLEKLVDEAAAATEPTFKYLTKMPMDSVTAENVVILLRDKEKVETEINDLENTTTSQLWLNELNVFENNYRAFCNDDTTGSGSGSAGAHTNNVKRTVAGAAAAKKKVVIKKKKNDDTKK